MSLHDEIRVAASNAEYVAALAMGKSVSFLHLNAAAVSLYVSERQEPVVYNQTMASSLNQRGEVLLLFPFQTGFAYNSTTEAAPVAVGDIFTYEGKRYRAIEFSLGDNNCGYLIRGVNEKKYAAFVA